MDFSIILAVNKNSSEKFVVDNVVSYLKKRNLKKLEFGIEKLIYESFQDINQFLNINSQNNIRKILILLDTPSLSLDQISLLRSNSILLQSFADINEHFHTFHKYAQFLYDGLLLMEPEYINHFSVFGVPVYDGSLFNWETARIIENNLNCEYLIPINQRLYDFSFIGRMDRPGRKEFINNLKGSFNNIFIHDSSKDFLSAKDLNEIIRNTKYFFNSTSTQPLNTFGLEKFPENFQLHRSSRILEYAVNGCIIFTEILPQKVYKTYCQKNIPFIEVPRGINQGEYCLNYLKKKDINIQYLSRKTFDAAKETYDIKNVIQFFENIINDLKSNSPKFSKINFSRSQKHKINFQYNQFIILAEVRKILISNYSFPYKFFNLVKIIKINIFRDDVNLPLIFIKFTILKIFNRFSKFFKN